MSETTKDYTPPAYATAEQISPGPDVFVPKAPPWPGDEEPAAVLAHEPPHALKDELEKALTEANDHRAVIKLALDALDQRTSSNAVKLLQSQAMVHNVKATRCTEAAALIAETVEGMDAR